MDMPCEIYISPRLNGVEVVDRSHAGYQSSSLETAWARVGRLGSCGPAGVPLWEPCYLGLPEKLTVSDMEVCWTEALQ